MLITETVIISNKEFIHNYSDSGYYIVREDGQMFEDAMDLPESRHTYTETDKKIPEPIDDEPDSID